MSSMTTEVTLLVDNGINVRKAATNKIVVRQVVGNILVHLHTVVDTNCKNLSLRHCLGKDSKFAKNCIKNEKMCHIFPLNQKIANLRNPEKVFVQPARTEKLARSAIPYMQRLLNRN